MSRFFPKTPRDQQSQAESLVAEVFRRDGWKVREHPRVDDRGPGLIAVHGGQKYVIEIKRSSEGRKDRLIPLASQAILQAQEVARREPAHSVPVAIVVADHILESVAKQVTDFARLHAPDVGVGVVDFEGLQTFEGLGLERLNSKRPDTRRCIPPGHRPSSPQLFSDLNQWMLKVLLAPSIPERYLSAPRGRYQGASQLARAADVSVMSAFRFIEQFSKAGFLEDEPGGLRVVRIEELLVRWLAANQRSISEIGLCWILQGNKNTLRDAAVRWCVASEKKEFRKRGRSQGDYHDVRRPRACLSLFAAAEALGVGAGYGVQPHLYLERIEPNILEKLGLAASSVGGDPDVYVCVPYSDESVFRAVVVNEGVPACDILQVWLDVAQRPSRGTEQADLIWHKILAPMLFESVVNVHPDEDSDDDRAKLTIQEFEHSILVDSICLALKLATQNDSYMTAEDVLDHLKSAGFNLSRYTLNPLSAVSTILGKFKPNEVETTMRGGTRAFRWAALSKRRILPQGPRKIRLDD